MVKRFSQANGEISGRASDPLHRRASAAAAFCGLLNAPVRPLF
jgi:hypothetical protein